MEYKKFIPCIYLENGNAVKGLQDNSVISMNPLELAISYSECGADEIMIMDLSTQDNEHEEHLLLMKEIAQRAGVPITGAGHINRMEDVKKILYAGCKKAILNLSKDSNLELIQEVSAKFGQDKIAGAFREFKTIKVYKKLIEQYISELVSLDELSLKESLAVTELPVLAMLPQISLDKMLNILSMKGISGISGDLVNENIKEINSLKKLSSENGILVNTFEPQLKWDDFKLNSDGLIPVVVQDYKTGQVLMVAYMNRESYEMTLETGKMTYYSRSRQELWLKGSTSGHFQHVKSLSIDCDLDTLLAKVSQIGAACHTGNYSCFFTDLVKKEYDDTNPNKVFEDVFGVIKDRKIHPKEGSYTNYLFDKGIDKILKKLGEEATEIVIAAKNPNPEEIKYEISDFLYHMMVLMAEKGISWEDITTELSQR